MSSRDSIHLIRQRLWNGELSSVALVEQAKAAAQATVDLNPLAFADFDLAIAQAQAADQLWNEHRQQPDKGLAEVPALLGIPVSIKDLFKVRGMPTRAGTRAPLPDSPLQEATLVARLRAAGAIIFAKTNMVEIAMGAHGENPVTGDVLNPYDPSRQAGGSSSGSSVAVACGIGVASVGSDTAGSIRIPAAFCGVVGFKPSFGSIPLNGGLFLSPSFDHAGPITRCVADARLLYGIMANRSPREFELSRPPTFGLLNRWLEHRLSPAMKSWFDRHVEKLRSHGASFVEVDVPDMVRTMEYYTPIARAETALIHKDAMRSHADRFSESTRATLEAAANITAVDYLEAQLVRTQVRQQVEQALRQCDAFLLPTSPVATPLRGQPEVHIKGGLFMSTREAVVGQNLPFSSLGLPAITLPAGKVTPEDSATPMPAGLQLVGQFQRDDLLLSLAQWAEALHLG